jgi:hypothetical protein
LYNQMPGVQGRGFITVVLAARVFGDSSQPLSRV